MTNVAIVSASNETVVQNDTSTTTHGSVNLASLGVPVTVTVGGYNVPTVAQSKLAQMEQARKSWETTELVASNKRLYSILRDAYSFYLVLKKDSCKETRKAREEELEDFIKEREYKFMPSTHDMTRVVKCVFGVDRRRVSAYSIALREALRQQIAAEDLVAFIEENGGVEQIRMGGSKPLSVSKRAAKAVDQVLGSDLGLLKLDPKLVAADADWTDKQVVIVATYLPTGEFQANAVIRHDSAVNSALAAFYSLQQAKLREVAKAERDANKAAEEAVKAAANAQKKQTQAESSKVVNAVEQSAQDAVTPGQEQALMEMQAA
jgi:hypothetical protein